MPTQPLPVSDIIIVNVSVASGAIAPRPFNQGLIVGSSPVIPSTGANARLRQYASLSGMIADGFTSSEPEYLAAEAYFGQSPAPQFVWVGRQDLTAIAAAIPHAGSAGTGYQVGDVVGVTELGGVNGYLSVLTVNAGVVLTLGVVPGTQGTGYTNNTNLSTFGGSGTGLKVDVTAVGESYLQAVEACYLVNQLWFPFMCCGASDSDHLALGAWSTSNWQNALYCGSTANGSIPAGLTGPGNVAYQMQQNKYKALISYNTTQSSTYPANIYAAAALIGLACGLNTGAPNSAFTLNLKPLADVTPELLTQAQFAAIESFNCNTVASFGPYSGYVFNGILSSGDFYDQILDRAMLINLIQTNLMNLLVSTPKIPQTDAGEHQLIAQVDAACEAIGLMGYLATGPSAIWNEAPVLNLQTGQALPLGYYNQAQSYAYQSAANRAARQAMPIYCAILEAGAVQSVIVNVNVQL